MAMSNRKCSAAAKWMVIAAITPVLVALVPGMVEIASAQSVPEIDLECSCTYTIQSNSITFGAAAVRNRRSGGTSGTLKLKVWATTTPYQGGTISGYVLASVTLGQLTGGYSYTSLSYTRSLDVPPAGTYYITMTVTEYNGQDFIMDYAAFDDTATFGGGSGSGNPGGSGTPRDDSADASECSYDVTVRNGADAFSAGTPISAPACWIEGSNVGASLQDNESSHAGNRGGASVWWVWTAPATGTAEFTTVGSSFDTLLAVYSVSASSLTEVASNDDIDRQNRNYQSAVEFDAQEGDKYYIAVDGYNGKTGNIVLHWRVQEAAQDLDDADPLDDFNVRIPASCPRQVEICVHDWSCEDGDRVKVSVNGVEVLRTELFNAPRCVDVSVREGVNTISLLALNGTGYKCGGGCEASCEPGANSNFYLTHPSNPNWVNTGEIQISGGGSQRWRHGGGAGSTANLNVTVGGSGSCP